MLKRFLLTPLLTLAVSLILLAAAVYLLGTNDSLMLGLMARYAPPETTGLPASEYAAVAAMTADFLAGETADFQHVYVLDGTEHLAFNAKEQQHMADVQGLFLLARDVMWVGLGLAGLVLVGLGLPDLIWKVHLVETMVFAVTGRSSRELNHDLRNGLFCVLGVVVVTAIAAAIDFEHLFTLFHRIAFTNDLWLLDPRTDLLIRLMPTEFFMTYAALIGLTWFTAMALVILLTHLLTKERNK